jgi:5-methylcytosine-specific restriction enzyme A
VTAALYNSYRWQQLRVVAKARDGYRCVACGRGGCRLDVDHVEPVNQRPDLAFVLENLRTLCRKCHNRRTHGKPRPKRRNSRRW